MPPPPGLIETSEDKDAANEVDVLREQTERERERDRDRDRQTERQTDGDRDRDRDRQTDRKTVIKREREFGSVFFRVFVAVWPIPIVLQHDSVLKGG